MTVSIFKFPTQQLIQGVESDCDFYRPRMQESKVFILSVCLSICLSACLSVKTIPPECLDTKILFLVWWYILIISRSSLSIKVLWSRSRSFW